MKLVTSCRNAKLWAHCDRAGCNGPLKEWAGGRG